MARPTRRARKLTIAFCERASVPLLVKAVEVIIVNAFEFCELWWSRSGSPLLTFYRPTGSEVVPVVSDDGGEADGWDALTTAVVDLNRSGWELVSVSHHGAGLFFKRHLQ